MRVQKSKQKRIWVAGLFIALSWLAFSFGNVALAGVTKSHSCIKKATFTGGKKRAFKCKVVAQKTTAPKKATAPGKTTPTKKAAPSTPVKKTAPAARPAATPAKSGKQDDSEKVVFVHKPPKAAVEGKALIIVGQIDNNDDLEDVFLYYRRQGTTRYQPVKMALTKGIVYTAVIKAKRIGFPGTEYYVQGLDVDNKTIPLLGSKSKPVQVKTVKKKDAPDTKDDEEKLADEETVVSATRKEQRIQKAPGVVTVITQADIEAGGWRNVAQLLRYSAGIDINMNGLGSADIGIRGLNPRLAFGDKMVFLLDGHNMSLRQLNRNSVTTTVTIDMIKRIEIIRGPGSALWGANALSGVVNIITKTRSDLNGVSGVLGGSPLSRSYFFSLQGGQEIINGVTFRGSFGVTKDFRSPITAPVLEFQKVAGVKYYQPGDTEYNQYFYSQVSWKGFSLSFFQSRFSAVAPYGSFSAIGGDDSLYLADRYIVKASWIGSLSKKGYETIVLWASVDAFGFEPGSQYESGGLNQAPSSSILNGGSGFYAIVNLDPRTKAPQIKGYYPNCALVQGQPVPCVKIKPGDALKNACTYYRSSQDKKGQEIGPGLCRPTYTNGRYLRPLLGDDLRVEGGAQVSFQGRPTKNTGLFFTIGADFEYADIFQVHSPDIWAALDLPDPSASNIHGSAFLHAQFNISNFIELTGGLRFDYDQQYGTVFTPRAAVVLSPGNGLYAKLLYGNAFKAPSFKDLYFFRKNSTYGNPDLKPESVHTVELQVGWYRSRLLSISVNGYYSLFQNLISYVDRKSPNEFVGAARFSEIVRADQLPDPGNTYRQSDNNESLTNYGGEMEFRLFPVKGLNIIGNAGVFLGEDANGRQAEYAARVRASLSASYRIQTKIPISIAAGVLFVGPKLTPATDFNAPGTLPSKDTNVDHAVPVPNWTAANDPTTHTPAYVHTYFSLQFLNILKNMDLVFRLNNLLNADIYDASDTILRPQNKFDVNVWVRLHY